MHTSEGKGHSALLLVPQPFAAHARTQGGSTHPQLPQGPRACVMERGDGTWPPARPGSPLPQLLHTVPMCLLGTGKTWLLSDTPCGPVHPPAAHAHGVHLCSAQKLHCRSPEAQEAAPPSTQRPESRKKHTMMGKGSTARKRLVMTP